MQFVIKLTSRSVDLNVVLFLSGKIIKAQAFLFSESTTRPKLLQTSKE
jgi:hypothetical protein